MTTVQSGNAQRSPAAHLWLWLGYALCLALAIPWYRQSGAMDPRWLGMPLWGWCAAAGALGMSLLTVIAVLRLWPDALAGEQAGGEQTASEQTAGEQTAGEQTASEQTAGKHSADRPTAENPIDAKQADD